MTADEARARLAQARVARMATADAHGIPHLVPVTFALDRDTIVTAVDAKPKRSAHLRRLANLWANPRASILVDDYNEDWALLWWVRADGLASVVADGPLFDRAIELLRARYEQYSRVDIVGPAIVVEVDRWVGWSAS